MANWRTDEETHKLIALWGDDNIQAQLEGCKRNKEVYERIAKGMSESGHTKTAEQCREKAKKLKSTYRKIKDKHNKTGEGRNKWIFLEAMDTVLADKPSTQPPVLIDTLEEDEAGPEQSVEEHEDSVNVSGGSSLGECDDQEMTPKSSTDEYGEGNKMCAAGNRSARLTQKKGKKREREEKLEKTMLAVVDRVMKAQESSDAKFTALEEKRMKFEEQLVEIEERQRREDREF